MKILFTIALALIALRIASAFTPADDHGLSAELYNLQNTAPDAIEGDVTFQNNGTNELSIRVGDLAGNAPPVFHPAMKFSLLAINSAGAQ
jgi:hypothetical protein